MFWHHYVKYTFQEMNWIKCLGIITTGLFSQFHETSFPELVNGM